MMGVDFDFAMYSKSDQGHRLSHVEFYGQMANVKRVTRWQILKAKTPALFLMLDDTFLSFFLISILRMVMMRRTVGFLFLPLPASIGTKPKNILKRAMLKILKRFNQIRVLTILPFSVEPKFEIVADGWVYDPQMWDLKKTARSRVKQRRASEEAKNWVLAIGNSSNDKCLMVCAMGPQDAGKGFSTYSKLPSLTKSSTTPICFAFGGEVSNELSTELSNYFHAGGIGVNRFISELELLDFYGAADFIWACYSPDNDQASGIFGRALQLGIPTIVRKGSLIHRLCIAEAHPHFAFDIETPSSFDEQICSFEASKTRRPATQFARISLTHLQEALGVPLNFGENE